MRDPSLIRDASISPDGLYRYMLLRRWNREGDLVLFVGLNPSTANAYADDPTVRRCMSFAKEWGYGGLMMVNLFAMRSTDPSLLLHRPDPVGPENNGWIHAANIGCETTVIMWGDKGDLKGRDKEVLEILQNPQMEKSIRCFGRTKRGNPRHPLYLKKSTQLEDFFDADAVVASKETATS